MYTITVTIQDGGINYEHCLPNQITRAPQKKENSGKMIDFINEFNSIFICSMFNKHLVKYFLYFLAA